VSTKGRGREMTRPGLLKEKGGNLNDPKKNTRETETRTASNGRSIRFTDHPYTESSKSEQINLEGGEEGKGTPVRQLRSGKTTLGRRKEQNSSASPSFDGLRLGPQMSGPPSR